MTTEAQAHEIYARVVAELRAKGLLVPSLPLELDKSRRRFGACHWRGNRATGVCWATKITLSRPLMALNPPEQIEKVIRHELAHAIAGRSAGHGPAWIIVARRCGDDGTRCYGPEVKTPDLPWRATCPKCGREHQKARPPRRSLWCRCLARPQFSPANALQFKAAESTRPAGAGVRDPLVEGVLAMRRAGKGFVAIDAAHGIHGKKGWWSWKICKDNGM